MNGDTEATIARIDERTKNMQASMTEFKETMEHDISVLHKILARDYVSLTQFKPVMIIAYGLIGTISVGVLTALVKVVMQ